MKRKEKRKTKKESGKGGKKEWIQFNKRKQK